MRRKSGLARHGGGGIPRPSTAEVVCEAAERGASTREGRCTELGGGIESVTKFEGGGGGGGTILRREGESEDGYENVCMGVKRR